MARKNTDYTGDALKDGYTCVGRRPVGALPGNFVSEETANEAEEYEEMLSEMGGRRFSRRRRDVDDDDYGY